LSLDHILASVAVESCLILEMAQVLRRKDDRVVVGAIPSAHSAWVEVSTAKLNVVLFDSATVALTGPAWFHAWQAGRTAKLLWSAWKRMRPLFCGPWTKESWAPLEDASATEIVRVIRAVAAGKAVCPPRFSLARFQCVARDVSLALKPPQKMKIRLGPKGAATGWPDLPWNIKKRIRNARRSKR